MIAPLPPLSFTEGTDSATFPARPNALPPVSRAKCPPASALPSHFARDVVPCARWTLCGVSPARFVGHRPTLQYHRTPTLRISIIPRRFAPRYTFGEIEFIGRVYSCASRRVPLLSSGRRGGVLISRYSDAVYYLTSYAGLDLGINLTGFAALPITPRAFAPDDSLRIPCITPSTLACSNTTALLRSPFFLRSASRMLAARHASSPAVRSTPSVLPSSHTDVH